MSDKPTKSIWLYVLRYGTRINANEIATALDMEPIVVRELLKSLVDSGAVLKHPRTPQTFIEYEVTDECHMPLGVTLAQVIEAREQAANRLSVQLCAEPQWRPV